MFRKKYEWVFHVAACTLFLSIPFFSTPEHNSNRVFSISDFVIRDLVQYMLLVAFFYLTYMVLIPRLYFTKKYIFFSIVILTGMWLIAFIPHVLFNNFPEVRRLVQRHEVINQRRNHANRNLERRVCRRVEARFIAAGTCQQ